MSARLTSISLGLAALLAAGRADAGQTVWLDFSALTLSAFSSVNGNTPPTSADVSAVRNTVIANMIEDYAHVDVQFTPFQPLTGRYTRVRFLDRTNGTLFGTTGSCLVATNCGGVGSWTQDVSEAEIYAGMLAGDSQWQGANATTARIALSLSHTASHELGHVLGLSHCHSGDDFVSSGQTCTDGFGSTSDVNVNWHIMASGASTGLTSAQRATRDRFFNLHSERRVLFQTVQPKNYWSPLGSLTGDLRADIIFGQRIGTASTRFVAAASSGSGFPSPAIWSSSSGSPSDYYYLADVTGDGKADLVFGRPTGSSSTRWFVQRSIGTVLGGVEDWASDRGEPGNIYRFADVDGDGRDDLIFGAVLADATVQWWVALSTGSSFAASAVWSNGAGDRDSVFLVADVTGDGKADLVALNRGDARLTVYRSTGSSFGAGTVSTNLSSPFLPEYVLLADVTGDGKADLLTGEVFGDFRVDWFVRTSNGCAATSGCFGTSTGWVVDAGDAGDYFRVGDGNGDGKVDLFYGRPAIASLTATPDPNTITWFGRLSTGSAFAGFTQWSGDMGDDGDIFP